MLSHIVRRGVQAAAQHLTRSESLDWQIVAVDGDVEYINAPAQFDHDIPWWGFTILAATILAYLVASVAFEYTVRILIVNLAIVESPTSTTVQKHTVVAVDGSTDPLLDKKGDPVDIEVEAVEVPNKPLTSSIRRTIRRLTSIGGFKACFAGFRLGALYSLIAAVFVFVFSVLPVFGRGISSVIPSVLAGFASARIHCAWTHKTIAMPSNKTLSERLITRAQQKQLLLPTAIKIIAADATVALTLLVTVVSVNGFHANAAADQPSKILGLLLTCAPIATFFAGLFFAVLPSYVVLIRMEASLLPEDEDTVVPMDRTFGGRLLDVSDKLSMKAAWKSFSGTSRVVKLFVKFFLIMVAASVLFGLIWILELTAIVGVDKLPMFVMAIKEEIETAGILQAF